jgi:phage shock protein A
MTPRCAALQSAVTHAEASLKRSEEATERTRQELAELRRQLEAEISRDAALSWETMKRTWRWEK